MVFDPDGAGNRALKEPYPIDARRLRLRQLDRADRRHHHRRPVGAGRRHRREPFGALGSARSRRAHEEPVKLLTERAYRARFPTAKTTVRHPLAQFDGRLELDDTRARPRRLDRQRQPQLGHPAHPGLRVRPGVRIRRRARLEPGDRDRPRRDRAGLAAGGHAVRVPPRGRRSSRCVRSWAACTPTASIGRSRGRSAARVGEQMIEGEITAEPADVIGLTYTDTDGGSKYCYNSAIATCRIQLAGKASSALSSSPPAGRCSRSSPTPATTRCRCWPSSKAPW